MLFFANVYKINGEAELINASKLCWKIVKLLFILVHWDILKIDLSNVNKAFTFFI